jgi:hypothetical protein
MTFVLAGHETTATLLSWWFFCVGSRQDVLEKCVAEVDALKGDEPSTEQLKQLTYMDATLKETLVRHEPRDCAVSFAVWQRLYPPLPLFQRQATEDHEIAGVRAVAHPSFNFPRSTRFPRELSSTSTFSSYTRKCSSRCWSEVAAHQEPGAVS